MSNWFLLGLFPELSAARLKDWQRYLQALSKRIEKLKVDVSRDRIQQLSIQKVQAAFDDVLGKATQRPARSKRVARNTMDDP